MPGDYSLATHTAFDALMWSLSAEGGRENFGICRRLLPFSVFKVLPSLIRCQMNYFPPSKLYCSDSQSNDGSLKPILHRI